MASSDKRSAGRPTKLAAPGKSVSLGLKVTSGLKSRLDNAAREAGRTQSKEAELRLEQSFRDEGQGRYFSDLYYGRELASLLEVLGRALRDVGAHAAAQSAATGSPDWLDDPYAFDMAMRAAIRVLEKFRPRGPIAKPPGSPAQARIDEAIVNGLLSDLAHELDERDFMEEWAAGVRDRLGRLRERLKGFDYDLGARSAALPSQHAPGVLLFDSDDPSILPNKEPKP